MGFQTREQGYFSHPAVNPQWLPLLFQVHVTTAFFSDLPTHTPAPGPGSYGLRNTNSFKHQDKRKTELVVEFSAIERFQIIGYLEWSFSITETRAQKITSQNPGEQPEGGGGSESESGFRD